MIVVSRDLRANGAASPAIIFHRYARFLFFSATVSGDSTVPFLAAYSASPRAGWPLDVAAAASTGDADWFFFCWCSLYFLRANRKPAIMVIG